MYIESKITKFIITDAHDISECLQLYTATQEFCNKSSGLSYELIDILGNLINLKSDIPEGDNFTDQMKVVESRLGKYVPDIIKKIISISENYEKKNCNKISNNTQTMKLLYSRIIKKNASHEDYEMPDIDIGGFFQSFQKNIITKSILLLFLAYLIGRIINLFSVRYNIKGI